MTQITDDSDENLSLLTVSDFIRLAADRDTRLWETSQAGIRLITNGRRKYVLPDMPEGRLPWELVESLCVRFDLPRLDFALDARDED
jgi:hypothetical protein